MYLKNNLLNEQLISPVVMFILMNSKGEFQLYQLETIARSLISHISRKLQQQTLFTLIIESVEVCRCQSKANATIDVGHVDRCCSHKEFWESIIAFPFVKDGPVYPMLKEIRKEALKHLS